MLMPRWLGIVQISLYSKTHNLCRAFPCPGVSLLPVEINQWVEDGEHFDLWGRDVEVLHCPGHCPGNVAFYFSQEKICFVGDVIFSGSVGRTDLPGGSFEELERSIQEKIYTLEQDTELAVGHGPNTTVGKEKNIQSLCAGLINTVEKIDSYWQ